MRLSSNSKFPGGRGRWGWERQSNGLVPTPAPGEKWERVGGSGHDTSDSMHNALVVWMLQNVHVHAYTCDLSQSICKHCHVLFPN